MSLMLMRARGSNSGDCRLPRFEPIGLDDFPELVERHPVLLAEADVGLSPLERQRHRFHAIHLLNGDAYPVRADGAVHAEDFQLDSRVLGSRLGRHQEQEYRQQRLRPERGAESPRESERPRLGVGPQAL